MITASCSHQVFLADGSFLWRSAKTGFAHLYHHKADGSLLGPVTSGDWEVDTVHGTGGGWVFFSGGSEGNSLNTYVHRIKLDG